MALCCREGPDGGIGPRGRNPKKLLELPLSKGLPLNGCMPLDASQLDATTRRSNTNSSHHDDGCRHVLLQTLLLVCKQPAMEKKTTTTTRHLYSTRRS
ncbi:hypothetical protein GUJ93_ZPchr0006g43007 [Zizania palustris]|uniref:Uncharacterized protein n=1 Tax=Zizania palustris TaxID=103762 RepID=A0A8J5TBT9_ZIZPA|nr:hypothetical protein GUJ93_ZPchr0006g43007 [Zizania palustris]